MHGQNIQANAIIDIIISLGTSLEYYNGKIENITKIISKSIGEKNKMILEIKENQHYVKTQIEEVQIKLKGVEHLKNVRQNHKKIMDQHKEEMLQKINKRAEELEKQYKDITILLDNLKRITLGEKV